MNDLFDEFDAVSAKAFKQKIQFDLNGAEYNSTLVWQSPEGIQVKPFYHRDDKISYQKVPGFPTTWEIGEEIFIEKLGPSLKTAKNALENGAETLCFCADKPFDATLLLSELALFNKPLRFKLNFLDQSFCESLFIEAKSKKVTIRSYCDIIGNLAATGNWFHSLEQDHHILNHIVSKFPTENILSINSTIYQNAGATIIQQLAYALAHANEYLNHFGDKLKKTILTFHLAVGSNYFFEIAKIRALRIVYAQIAKAYDLPETCHIITIPSNRNSVIYDYNTNLLRTTTASMSAILGGSNTVINTAYDNLFKKQNEFSRRIARNQLLILKNESHFENGTNPANGSYYIESLTHQFTTKALALFKEIEKQGGFLKQLKKGDIQRKIKENDQKEQENFDSGAQTLLGINSFPNAVDRMKTELELYPFLKTNPRKTLIAPIIPRRLAENLEQKRLKNE